MRAEFQRLWEEVQRAAAKLGVRDFEAITAMQSESLTRFANNAIHQNVTERSGMLSVRVVIAGKTARASTNRFDPDSIHRALEDSLTLAKAVAPDLSAPSLYEGAPSEPVDRWDERIACATPDDRARVAREAIRIVESAGQTAAGIYSTEWVHQALFNSRGVSVSHSETMSRFSITALAEDSSGWAKASGTRLGDFDPDTLARSASRKAKASANPREIEPGTYTVVLEPAAVLDLVGQIFGDFSGTAVLDQRSFLSGREGQKLFGDNITIYDDSRHPAQAGAGYDGEGVPRRRLTLVDQGTPKDLAYSRATALKVGRSATGHGFPLPNELGESPLNIVMLGGDASLESLISSTDRGILVTRLWYIREVDPYEKIMTGMTRDGTFLIENGAVVCGLRNFRFNQSVIDLLRNVEALTPAARTSGEEAFDMVVPALKASGFHFSEVTRF